MPYKSLKAANPAILGIKPPVTLAQANAIAKHADGLEKRGNSIKSPWGVAISQFKKANIAKGGSWVKREAKEFAEAATIKKRAQRLLRDAEALLATRKLPAAVRKEIRDLRTALRKTWANLSDESDNEWEAESESGELDMEMMDAMRIDVDGEKIAFSDLVEAWKAKAGSSEPVSEYYPDAEEVYIPYGTAVSFTDLQAAEEAEHAIAETRNLTSQFQALVGNIMYSAEIVSGKKLDAIRVLTDEFIALVAEQVKDIGEAAPEQEPVEDGMVELAESMGNIVFLGESESAEKGTVPLRLDIAIVEPGWGNTRDNHYYPREMLGQKINTERFVGAKMRESQHNQADDQSTRSWVSTIKEMAGFTDSGAPIARVVVHDRSFAERLRALAEEGMINMMECSILARGKAKPGEVDGKKANIVEAITEVAFVDWVMRAGAGGRALNIAEAEQEAAMPDKEVITEEAEELEEATDVTLAEGEEQPDQKPEPEPEPVAEQEPEQEEPLGEAEVQEALDSTNLPGEAKAWLLETKYQDKGQLAEAVGKAIERVKAMTGSGQVVGMGESDPPAVPKPLTEEEKVARFNAIMLEVGAKEV